jgi:hypothetical protein
MYIPKKFLFCFFVGSLILTQNLASSQEPLSEQQAPKVIYEGTKEGVKLTAILNRASGNEISLLIEAKPNSTKIEKVTLIDPSGKAYKPTQTLRGTQVEKAGKPTAVQRVPLQMTFGGQGSAEAPRQTQETCHGSADTASKQTRSPEEDQMIAASLGLLMASKDVTRKELVLVTFNTDKVVSGDCSAKVDVSKDSQRVKFDISFRIVPQVSVLVCQCGGEGCDCAENLACGGAMEGVIYGGGEETKAIKRCPRRKPCACGGENCRCTRHLACGGTKEVIIPVVVEDISADDKKKLDQLKREIEESEKKAQESQQEADAANKEAEAKESSAKQLCKEASEAARRFLRAEGRYEKFSNDAEYYKLHMRCVSGEAWQLAQRIKGAEALSGAGYEDKKKLEDLKDRRNKVRQEFKETQAKLKEAEENAEAEKKEMERAQKEAVSLREKCNQARAEASAALARAKESIDKAKEARQKADEAKEKYEKAKKEIEEKAKKRKPPEPKKKKVCAG